MKICPKCGESEATEQNGIFLCTHCSSEMHFDSLESANLEAAYSYLEDGEYDKAEEKFKCVLDVDEKCAAA